MSLNERASTDDAVFPKWALKLVRCPLTKEELRPAEEDLVHALQQLQQAGRLLNQMQVTCEEAFDAGLVNESRTYFHPSRAGIQTLIPSEAIPMGQLDLT